MPPEISVIIPTYNRAHLLGRAMNSVLAQSVDDFELIVVDDASTEDIAHVVNGYGDARIIYKRHDKNQGGPAARNTGIDESIGTFLAFLDSDDEWLPSKLEKQLALFKQSDEKLGMVYTAYRKSGRRSEKKALQLRGDIYNQLLVCNHIGTTSTPLIRKSCFEQVGPFDTRFPSCQDWEMWVRIARNFSIDYIDEILVFHHFHAKSISMDTRASINGHKMFAEKFAADIARLPARMRAEHYLNLGKNFWHKRDFAATFVNLATALGTSLHTAPDIAELLLLNRLRKIFSRHKQPEDE